VQVKCRNRIFDVYTQSEADDDEIPYTSDWRNAEVGDWILTDDEKVLEVLGRRQRKHKSYKKPVVFIRTGYGETPTYKQRIHAKKRADYEWDSRYKKGLRYNVKPTALQTAFMENLLGGGKMAADGMWTTESIINAYQSVYAENNPSVSLRRGLAILRKKTVKEHMSKIMRPVLVDKGIDDDYVAEKLKNFIEDLDVPAGTRFMALGKASDLLGHSEKEKEERAQTVFMLSDGDKKLLAHVRKELSDKEIGKLMKKAKESGIDGVVEDENSSG